MTPDLSRTRHVRLTRTPPRNVLMRAWALYRQRKHLADLDARLLADAGLDVESARLEAARPVWDAPRHWYR